VLEDITKAEFEKIPGSRRPGSGRHKLPETLRLETLLVDEGFKVPCRWKHSPPPKNGCGGHGIMHGVARRAGFKISSRCWQGTVYVLRVE